MLWRPSSDVAGDGFIPSVPCCVIVISLQGPTTTDEVNLTCQSRSFGPRPGPPRSPQSHIRRAPNCKDFQKKTTLNGKLTQQCIVLTNKVANETVNLSRFKCIPQSPKTGRYARLFVVSQYLKSSIHFASLKKMRLPFQDTKIFLFLSFLYMCVCFLIVTYSFWNQLNAKFKSGINSTLLNKLS